MQIQRQTSAFQDSNTLRTQLVNPKDKDPKTQKSGIIYHYKCPHINCPEAYIGESGRALGERVKEHFKAPSPIFNDSSSTGHSSDPDNFSIIHKEVHSHSRTIKEAMFICVNDPTLNRNLGNTNFHMNGTAYYRHYQCYSSSLPAFPPPLPPCLPLTIHNSQPSPHIALPPPNSLSRWMHVLFLVSIKHRGSQYPQKHLQSPPQLIQTLPHTAAPSR